MFKRRSNPFRDSDWLYKLNDHPEARYPTYTLEELINKYPHLGEDLTRIANRGLPINPITVRDLNPSRPIRQLIIVCVLSLTLAVIYTLA